MLKNYFKIAMRTVWRNKTFSMINILGLSIGISAALVIFLMAYYEFSFDRFVPEKDSVYRLVLDINVNGNEGHSAGVQAPLAAAIQKEIVGVDKTVPVFQFQGDATAKVTLSKTGAEIPIVFKKQANIIFTNSEYFYLIPHQWMAGSPQSSLQEPFSTVLTESRAKLYFPGVPIAQIIGQKLQYNSDLLTTVTGIVKDLNEKTSFNEVEFISLPTISKTRLKEQFMMDNWGDWMAYSQLYLKLSKGQDVAQIENSCTDLIKRNNTGGNQDFINGIKCHLQPITDIHFNNKYQGVGQTTASRPVLFSLLLIAVFLLLLACINFINLTTANATHRAKEIGIRKTMGGSKRSLIFQFLGETFFITCMATMLAVLFAPMIMKTFREFMPDGMQFSSFSKPMIFIFLLGLTLLVSFLSGLYPGFVLSGLIPVNILKGQSAISSSESKSGWIRKSLTVSQFVIAQFFLIATLVVSKQINFSLNSDLGFNKDAIITFELPRDTSKTKPTQLLNAIKSIPEVKLTSTGFLSPADLGVAFTNIKYEGKEEIKANIQIRWGDPDFLNVYQLKLLAGKNVQPSEEMKEFIINEKYSQLLGFENPEAALGKFLEFNGKKLPIVGVMQNFHDISMCGDISPLVFAGSSGSFFHIKLNPNDIGANTWMNAIQKIQQAYKNTYPEEDFSYKFFDETIASMYDTETRTAGLLKVTTGLMIFISCLGLLGLVMFTINTRMKEIGIRKILGSSVTGLVSLLSMDFVRLVVIAFLIAAPLAWWTMQSWLNDYAYRTPLSWWLFIVSGAGMIFIAVLTLSMQTINAATSNPVKTLRSE